MAGNRHRYAWIALVVGLLAPGCVAREAPAHPPAPVGPEGEPLGGKLHRWLHQARAPLVRGRVQIVRRGCPARPRFTACVYGRHPRRIYMRRGLRDPRYVLYHELGHVFDLLVLNRRERRLFRRIVHRRGGRWFSGARPSGELFAEGYADCALFGSRRTPRRSSVYGYAPSRAQHRAVCALIARAAAPGGPRPQPPPKPPRVIGPTTAPAPTPPPASPSPQPAPGRPPPQSPTDLLDMLL